METGVGAAGRPLGRAGVWMLGLATLVVAGGGASACRQGPGSGQRAPSTERMAARLEELARSADPSENVFLNLRRARALQDSPVPTSARERLVRRGRIAKELLQAGELDLAIDELEELSGEVDRADPAVGEVGRTVGELLAVGYLHRSIQRNCVEARAPRRCLVPVPPGAAYPDPSDSRAAARLYAAFLRDHPRDLLARWLLNLSHMTLGTHPDGVPGRWRIPRAAFASEDTVGLFRDVAPDAGVDAPGHAGGGVLDDLDGDGLLDLIVSSRGLDDPLRYFRNEGDGTFDEETEAADLRGLVGGLNLAQADYDNDGDVDVLVLRGGWLPRPYPNSLLRNDGDGTFTDVTEEAGLLEPAATQVGAWADYDGDGWLDLFVGNESRDGEGPPSMLYRNEGDGTFREVAARAGLDVRGFVKGADWGDYDNDGRPDLYVSRLGEPNLLFHNDGPGPDGGWTFSEVSAEAGVREPRASFPTWFFDFDNDGWLDIFVSGYRAARGAVPAEYLGREPRAVFPRLYRNLGDGTFADVTGRAGLRRVLYTMGSNHGDLDNDGYPDIYLGTGEPDLRALMPNRAFRNGRAGPDAGAAGRRFREVTAVAGLGHLGKGHAVSFGDVDNDGDQDVHAVLGGAYEGDVYRNALYENPGHGHRWITLRLEGRGANRSGLGSRIAVTVVTPSGRRTIRTMVGGGGSFGASSLQQEIGLGDATEIRSVEVRWAGSGTRDVFRDLSLDRVYRIVEGSARARPVNPPRVDLPR